LYGYIAVFDRGYAARIALGDQVFSTKDGRKIGTTRHRKLYSRAGNFVCYLRAADPSADPSAAFINLLDAQ
jgi:hypothetical protein